MFETVVSKPIYRVLTDLTQEPRLEVALTLAVKDLVRLRLAEAQEHRKTFEQRYGMDFDSFRQAWSDERIADKYSYQVECDYREWEATITDEARLREMWEVLP